ncbi:hypothetical protein BH11MYX4_BH11MYX4_17900 [soil metagenome]
MRRLGVGIGMSVALACVLVACGAARLPAPTSVGQPTEALLEADYPPPPARVEHVPASPRSDAVWIDGEWTWQGSRWAWKTGRWVAAPASASFSPWTAVRGKTGTYYVAEGKWRDSKGVEIADPPALSVAKVRGGSVTNAEGEAVPQTPNVRPDTPESLARRGKREKEAGPPETPSGATPTGTEPKHDGGTAVDAGLPDA